MVIHERLLADMKQAQKAGDKLRLGAIRWIRDAIQKEAKARRGELSDEETLQILAKLAKKYRDSIELAVKGGREDLAEREREELKVLEEYLPRKLTEKEILELVEEAISKTSAKELKDLGAVMKALKPEWAGRADGKMVSELVKKRLAQL